jgi:hypothetical protein
VYNVCTVETPVEQRKKRSQTFIELLLIVGTLGSARFSYAKYNGDVGIPLCSLRKSMVVVILIQYFCCSALLVENTKLIQQQVFYNLLFLYISCSFYNATTQNEKSLFL